jgi:hypothetical protein
MKRRQIKKLNLTSETLRQLNPDQVLHAEGGIFQRDTGGNTQEPSYCNACTTSDTLFQAQCR